MSPGVPGITSGLWLQNSTPFVEEARLDKNLGYHVHYPQVLSMAAADTAIAKARQVFSKHGGMLRTSMSSIAWRAALRSLTTLREGRTGALGPNHHPQECSNGHALGFGFIVRKQLPNWIAWKRTRSSSGV